MTQAITIGVLAGAASVGALLFRSNRGTPPDRATCAACGQRQSHKPWCPHR